MSNKWINTNKNFTILNDKIKYINEGKIYAGIQPKTPKDENSIRFVTKDCPEPFSDLEFFIYTIIEVDGESCIVKLKLNDFMNENTEYPIWETAFKNTKEEVDIFRFSGVSEFRENAFVITNKSKLGGAACLFSVLDHLCAIADKWIILPSSIHEVIVFPYDEECDNIEVYSDMVAEMNGIVCSEQEVLNNHVYLLDFTKHTFDK